MESNPTFSVIIPCYNEGQYIGLLLEDLVQKFLPEHVVVADCASWDTTVQVAKSYVGALPLTIVHSSGRSPAAARNTGAASIKDSPSSYLVFVDADMRVPSNFLSTADQILREHPEIDFITPTFASDGGSRLDTFIVRLINANSRRLINQQHKVAGIGGTMIVRRTLHEAIGGFQDIDQEDAAYVATIDKRRAKAYFMDDVVVTNSSRRAQKDGTLSLLLDFLPRGARTTKLIYTLSGKTPRQYGHYYEKS